MSWAIKRQVDEVASYDLTSYLLLLVKNSNLKAIVVSQQRQKNKFWIFEHRHRHFAQFKNGWETRPGGKFQPQSNVSLVSSYGMGGTERNWKWPHLLGNKLTRYGDYSKVGQKNKIETPLLISHGPLQKLQKNLLIASGFRKMKMLLP